MIPKYKAYRNKSLLAAAEGEECTIESPLCNHNPATVVACHSNEREDGKGFHLKADDCFIAFGCSACHEWYDRNSHGDLQRQVFVRGMKRTWKRLLEKGVLK